MPPFIIDWLRHNLARFIGVVCIGAIIIGTPFLIYRAGYHKGYKVMAQECMARPTNTYNAPSTVIQKEAVKLWGLKFGKYGFGFVKE